MKRFLIDLYDEYGVGAVWLVLGPWGAIVGYIAGILISL